MLQRAEAAVAEAAPQPGNGETLLIVDDDKAFLQRQARAMAALEWPLVQMAWRVMSAPDGRSAPVAGWMRSRVGTAWAEVRRRCGGEDAAMAAFVHTVRKQTATDVDDQRMRRVLAAYGRWARAVDGQDSVSDMQEDLAHCNRFEKLVRAGYAVWWEPTPAGKRHWVQLIVENDTSRRYWVDLLGELWATDPRPNPGRFVERDPASGGYQFGWGGSSADSMYAYPNSRSAAFVIWSNDRYLHTSADGGLYGVRPEMLIRDSGHTCSLPVMRQN